MEPEYPCMKPDMVISWDQHLKNGNVWKANVELSMQGGDNDEQLFYDTKKKVYCAPINSTKHGNQVDIKDTRNYTAMQLNLNPLMAAFS
jgi:hypothetical protein